MASATITTNITLPRDDWKALKIVAMEQGVSMAEFVRRVVGRTVRQATRALLRKRRLTVNGFTPEFEEEILKSAAEPMKNDIEWNGKGSFTDFVLSHTRD